MGSVVKVSNISSLVSDDTLRELFAHLGRIASITFVGSGQFGSGTKEALVEFADPGAAAIAMHLTGTELADHMLLVTSHTPAPAAAPVASVSNVAALFAGFVPTALPVQPVNSLMGTALGQGVPGTNIKNPYVTPQLYQLDPSKADEIGRTVYVGNISLLISELDLTQMFSACGPVTFIKMAGDPAHGCRFAFVEFAVADAANEAVKLHGTPLAERPLKVTYSKNAINKGPKKLDSETLRRVREAELRILQRDKNLELAAAASGGSDGERRRREKSRSRSYDRRRDRSRDRRRRRSRSRSPERRRRSRSPPPRDRDRDRSLDRSSRRDKDRDRDSRRDRDRDRDRTRDRRSRSRSRSGERRRSRRERSRSRSRERRRRDAGSRERRERGAGSGHKTEEAEKTGAGQV